MLTSSPQSIIGLTGTNASGKGAAALFLTEHGYDFYSLSDVLRETMAKQGIMESRLAFIDIGTQLRQEHGVDVLAKKTIEKIEQNPSKKIVVDSFRHPSEVELFKKTYANFILLCIDAPVELRFERAKKRGRAENADTLEQFIHNETLESSNNQQAQQLNATLALADHTLINQDNLADLHQQLTAFLP
ncbi:MAG TPA: AAA family ATPase [Oligoflexia bacterium]|nr:AAA family ATPase [Oligoflexia bacterium]HMR24691.1 AAA family ATPase [Oligoflexia bacterium]